MKEKRYDQERGTNLRRARVAAGLTALSTHVVDTDTDMLEVSLALTLVLQDALRAAGHPVYSVDDLIADLQEDLDIP